MTEPWTSNGRSGPESTITEQSGHTLESLRTWNENWSARAESVTAQVRDITARMAHMTVTAASPYGEVEVTVGAGGELVDLRLDPQVDGWRADEIATEILQIAEKARAQLSEQLADLVDGTDLAPKHRRAIADSFRWAAPGSESGDTARSRWVANGG